MVPSTKRLAIGNAIVALIFCTLFTGCVSQTAPPEVKKTDGFVFYPPPPDAPRYQFLTSFKGPADFDKKAALGSFLGSASAEAVQIKKPYGVVIQNGVIFVGDTTAGIYQFDLNNKRFMAFKGSKGLGKIVEPLDITTDGEGNIYVCDPTRRQVLQYDRNEFFIRAFSYPETWKPVDAKVYEGKLYVADATKGTGGVRVFDQKSGRFLETIGQSGSPEQKLALAINLDFDGDGYLYVTDVSNFGIMKYDRDGHFRGKLGGPGDSPGFFGRPRGIAVDKAGKIYAVDAAFDVVQVFSATGQLLTFFGNAEDSEPGALTLPAGIAIDYNNIALFKQYAAPGFELEYLILVTSQFNTNQVVNIYGYGKMAGAQYKSDQELYQELQQKLEKEKLKSSK